MDGARSRRPWPRIEATTDRCLTVPSPAAPFKTPEGVDELRRRTRGLGQRHRTVLLLVDGRRSLGEVLGMALQAGAATQHFEDLVRLGLVDVPADTMAPEPVETAPGALDLPVLTSVDLEVPSPAEAGAVSHDDGPDLAGDPDGQPMPEAAAAGPAAVEPEPAPVLESSRAPAPAPAPPRRPLATLPQWLQFRDPDAPVADHARPRAPVTEASLHHQVRSLLVGALGAEAALFGPLTLGRIRTAHTQRQLIELVWEIERQRQHPRRNRAQLLSLQRARELLGMGNTLVAGDSQPGNTWPDTQGQ